jgi:hypothetical protein
MLFSRWTISRVHLVCMSIHSSSANSLAELRFSGSYCSIFRIKRKKHSLSSPSRDVSLSSSGAGSGMGIPAQNSPSNASLILNTDPQVPRNSPSAEKNLLLRFARARRLGGGGPRRAIISARWARPRYVSSSGSWPVNKCSPSNASQIKKKKKKKKKKGYGLAIERLFESIVLTMHPTFQISTLYVHGISKIISGAR